MVVGGSWMVVRCMMDGCLGNHEWSLRNYECLFGNLGWRFGGDHDCFFQDSCMLARGTVDVAWGIMNGRVGHHKW